MRISKKAYYGVRATLALAQAKKPLSIHNLALVENLPEDYLEKILQALRRRGIVVAKKGVSGGYTIARAPRDISMWDIVYTLDGAMRTFAAPEKHSGSLPCPEVTHCQSNEVWRLLEDKIKSTLSKISVAELTPKH